MWESLFTVASGYLGVRGFPEEGLEAGPTLPGIYVAGVFDPDADGVPEIVNVTNFMAVEILLQGQRFELTADRLKDYRRMVDLKRGLLRRALIYRESDRTTRIEFERFVSLSSGHLAGQSVRITPLDWRGEVSVGMWMDARVRNISKPHLRLLHSRHVARDRILLVTETEQTRIRIGHACRTRAWVHQTAPPKPLHVGSGERLGLRYDACLECGQRAVFDRIVATYTSRDTATTSVERCCLQDVRGLEGAAYGVHRRRHVRAWARRWNRVDIRIEGPADDQRALRFAIFHLIQSSPSHDPTVSIAAKGLTGEGYRGHVFWDTEVFMLPFFVCADPPVARRLLQYRHHTLDGARRKARAAGYAGAMFAWESADTGDETTPHYVPDPKTGAPVRVWCGEIEQHVSADIVYAAWKYVLATGDTDFRNNQLLVLAVETARFWASRVWRNRRTGRYEIRDVIGPDEYHEHVNNNAFTNYMAAWNLRLAADEVARIKTGDAAPGALDPPGVTDEEVSRWRTIADAMLLPIGLSPPGLTDRPKGPEAPPALEQHEGFFALRDTDPRSLSALVSLAPEKERMGQIHGAQILKQADVIMLMVLFPDKFPRRVKQRNWAYYEPRTTHDSSLSASTHSIAASDLGLTRKAYEYFRRSAFLDIHDLHKNTDMGLHCAAFGGTWQAVVRGFFGLRTDGPEPTVRPSLPGAWKSASTQIQHRGRRYAIEVSRSAAQVRPISPAKR
ncbi:hypothetical protein AMJ85_01905 [candidate division BRC1 bacterium SM23_51]|nr:MAG: hypothetical protein AMJ85_01905 [candidate division BRC1 bacterium SM23_51]